MTLAPVSQVAQAFGTRNEVQHSLLDGSVNTYSNSASGLSGFIGDVFVIQGSATQVVRVTRVSVTGTATTSSAPDVNLVKRSTADTGGSFISGGNCSHDSNSPNGTATVFQYSAAPVVGNPIGLPVRSAKLFAVSPGSAPLPQVWDFGHGPKQALILRGIAQSLCVNFSAASPGGSFDFDVEWTESLT
jgi:hypothetical protein